MVKLATLQYTELPRIRPVELLKQIIESTTNYSSDGIYIFDAGQDWCKIAFNEDSNQTTKLVETLQNAFSIVYGTKLVVHKYFLRKNSE